ncbi:AmmeMemoRadiSam system radical SAM enzyme [Anaerovorax odorimutans]|uniref:AmmeMemoRadiSam system radical SAM enzyme n=1 Tax=Anaerovorax odorimutans TaxID=109327 RepID=A0ABT1RJM6_9FIRM|nr:AmmeMemoRadiSam system radical SAM enzyme [Anaerovorax odorimutans]MCQ4635392.1 AmmeMemoRadiSam system radical SAM enzyme [Anaerovorax odorimutans]
MKTRCEVCMHRCLLEPQQPGICGARKNEGGTIISTNYGKVTALALDPIEKKPLKRFFPGSGILSVGSYGCNLKCPFCQNYQIAQSASCEEAFGIYDISPLELVEKALELKSAGNIGLAFTYNEPLIGFEFVRDTARLAQSRGLKNVVVTNGSVTQKTAEAVLPYIDAMNIDLKGFTQRYYKMLGGDLETVKAFIRRAAGSCHVELTTLIVPGENDSDREIRELSQWIAAIDPEIPLHITRFFPNWRMRDRGPTEVKRIYELVDIAGQYLNYVFAGNC